MTRRGVDSDEEAEDSRSVLARPLDENILSTWMLLYKAREVPNLLLSGGRVVNDDPEIVLRRVSGDLLRRDEA